MKNILVLCGGQSPEHVISVRSARNILNAMDHSKYKITLVGISQKGAWRLINMEDMGDEIIAQGCPVVIHPGEKECLTSEGKSLGVIDAVFPILHGPNGVKGEPFTNLRYNTSDINQMELAFSNSLKAGNLNQAQYDQSIKNLNSSFEGLTGADNEKAIVQRLTTQGEKINKGTF